MNAKMSFIKKTFFFALLCSQKLKIGTLSLFEGKTYYDSDLRNFEIKNHCITTKKLFIFFFPSISSEK